MGLISNWDFGQQDASWNNSFFINFLIHYSFDLCINLLKFSHKIIIRKTTKQTHSQSFIFLNPRKDLILVRILLPECNNSLSVCASIVVLHGEKWVDDQCQSTMQMKRKWISFKSYQIPLNWFKLENELFFLES